LLHELGQLEQALAARGGGALKLGVVFRDDAQSLGTRAAISGLRWSGQPLLAPENLGRRVRIDSYATTAQNLDALVRAYSEFAPDVVVLIGGSELIDDLLAPLERAWIASRAQNPQRERHPEYLLTESAKVPELLQLIDKQPELRAHVRGIGATIGSESSRVANAFIAAYLLRYPGEALTGSAWLGASYDAAYALALGLVASQPAAISGKAIAAGLRHLDSGSDFALAPSDVPAAFAALSREGTITAIGSQAELSWDERGAIARGALEVWCVGLADRVPVFASSGRRADLRTQLITGDETGCDVGSAPTRESLPLPGEVNGGVRTAAASSAAPDGGIPESARSEPMTTARNPSHEDILDAGVPLDAAVDGGARPREGSASPAAAGGPSPAPADGGSTDGVPCGASRCAPDRHEYCCILRITGVANAAAPEDFSCEVAPKSECVARLQCSHDRDCLSGQACCLDAARSGTCAAVDSCGSIRLACNSSRDCAPGQGCCLSAPIELGTPVGTTCSETCAPFMGTGPLLCDRDADCKGTGGQRCVSSAALPSLKVCL
jgi:hypothetical protein